MFNKLAKARKMRKPPGTLGLKKFGPGKLWVKKNLTQNIFIDFLAELENNFTNFGKSYLDPKLKNNWGPLSSTFHVGRPEMLTVGNPKV